MLYCLLENARERKQKREIQDTYSLIRLDSSARSLLSARAIFGDFFCLFSALLSLDPRLPPFLGDRGGEKKTPPCRDFASKGMEIGRGLYKKNLEVAKQFAVKHCKAVQKNSGARFPLLSKHAFELSNPVRLHSFFSSFSQAAIPPASDRYLFAGRRNDRRQVGWGKGGGNNNNGGGGGKGRSSKKGFFLFPRSPLAFSPLIRSDQLELGRRIEQT